MRRILMPAILGIVLVSLAPHAFAGGKTFAQKHPRRAEVLGRANHQKNVNNQDAVNGKLTDGQAKKLDHEDNSIKRQEQADAKANGGFITKSEQQGLNREENRVNQQRAGMERNDKTGQGTQFAKEHPRRAEVLRRDSREVGANDAAQATGKINAGQANRLNKEDAAIARQEQADAKAHGGTITKQEQLQLNREENSVNRQRARMEQRDASKANVPPPAAATPPASSGQ